MDKEYFPLNKEQVENLTTQYGTPFYIYDEEEIRKNFRLFMKAFSAFPQFKEYFSVKACPNPYVLKILKNEGSGASCSTLAEIILAENAGYTGEQIIFSVTETSAKEIIYANLKGCLFYLDDFNHIDFVNKTLGGVPEFLSFCYKIDLSQKHNTIEPSKFGLTKEQLFEAYQISKEKGTEKFGLHIMQSVNQLNPNFIIHLAEELFTLAVEIKDKTGVKIDKIDFSECMGIPYDIDETPIDYEYLANKIKLAYDKILVPAGLDSINIIFECGRVITGPYGWLITKVIHKKHSDKNYIGVDASIGDLMVLKMNDNYHKITVSGKENKEKTQIYDVVGFLYDNNDNFAIQRHMPKVENGDLIILHNMGAYSRALESNYNGKLRSGELLLRSNGTVMSIRRHETLDDYFSTIDFVKLKTFSV